MSVTRLFSLGIRFAAWVTPRVKEWNRKRRLDQSEAERHLKARNWVEAERHLELALVGHKRLDRRRFELLLSLAEALRNQGRLAEADETLQTLLAESVADRDIRVRALDAQADVQLDRKEYAAAEETLKTIEELVGESKQPDGRRIAAASRKLGVALLHGGRRADAMVAFERAVQLSEKAFGPDHVETAAAFNELGARYSELGSHYEAQRCIRRALEIHRKATGEDSFQTTEDLFNLASSLAESGNLGAAATEYERILALRERQIGADRTQTAETQVRLAAIYVRSGRSSAARELLTHAIGVLDRGKGGPRLEFAFETMAKVEEAIHRPEDAVIWRERAAHALARRSPQPVGSPRE
ncbi:MAG TPA: tetratricopeptide repeat protein [Bryobacteraceae bacterium]|nr:tetratricopeptide repeat protein [Bryobacteraceae bacterium]